MKINLILLLAVIVTLAACDGVQVGDSNSAVGSENQSNIDSNNVNIGNPESSGRICLRCETEEGLESLGYEVESFLNCSSICPQEEDGSGIEEQCDLDCIADRLEIAAEVCRTENGCEVEDEVAAE